MTDRSLVLAQVDAQAGAGQRAVGNIGGVILGRHLEGRAFHDTGARLMGWLGRDEVLGRRMREERWDCEPTDK